MHDKNYWLDSFKSTFLSKIGITVDDAGLSDEDIFRLYYPMNVYTAVLYYIDKYDLYPVSGWL